MLTLKSILAKLVEQLDSGNLEVETCNKKVSNIVGYILLNLLVISYFQYISVTNFTKYLKLFKVLFYFI